MSNPSENRNSSGDNHRKEKSTLGSNVEHTTESHNIKEKELEKLSQSGFSDPGSRPRSGERERSSGSDPLAPGLAGKATP